jgi:hypothetical protein
MISDIQEPDLPKLKRSDKCFIPGCTNKPRYFLCGKIWAVEDPDHDYEPMNLETAIQFCQKHRSKKIGADVRNSIAYAAVRMAKTMGGAVPDPLSLELNTKKISKAIIQ